MHTARNVTMALFCLAAFVSLAWPAALFWYAVIVVGGWVLFGAGVAMLMLLGLTGPSSAPR
ncbi:MAG: hypothetical protein AELANPGJ_02067 [Anaerolineae bacterium]|nr:hypothetical protein [Anaerolineae bacterium]